MKDFLTYGLARFYDLFKVASNKAYTALAAFLVTVQMQMTDPETISELNALLPDQPLMVRLITLLPTVLLALFGTNTSQKMNEFRRTKTGTL